MRKSIRGLRITAALGIIATLLIGSIVPVNAATPTKESVKYLGSGKVEVEFYQDVDYKKPKVTVKDTSGKSYTASIYSRDDDEIKFKIKNYTKGKTYNFSISGVRKEFTKTYGTVKGKVSIPKTTITRTKAKTIAKNHAINKWGIKSSRIRGLESETDTYRGTSCWEVSFEAGNYEYEYDIRKSDGKVMHYHREYDD